MGVPVLPYVKQLKKESALRSNYKKVKRHMGNDAVILRELAK